MVVRVAVQERHRFTREALAMVLDCDPAIEVIGTAETGTDVSRLCDAHRPDAVVLELDGASDGWRLAHVLCSRHGRLRVVGLASDGPAVTPYGPGPSAVDCVVPRSAGIPGILQAVRPTEGDRSAGSYTPVARRSARVRTGQQLSARELEVLRFVACGLSTKEIARQLSIGVKTIENHKQRVFIKLGVHNQAHAVAVAIRRGLLAATVDTHKAK